MARFLDSGEGIVGEWRVTVAAKSAERQGAALRADYASEVRATFAAETLAGFDFGAAKCTVSAVDRFSAYRAKLAGVVHLGATMCASAAVAFLLLRLTLYLLLLFVLFLLLLLILIVHTDFCNLAAKVRI